MAVRLGAQVLVGDRYRVEARSTPGLADVLPLGRLQAKQSVVVTGRKYRAWLYLSEPP